MTDRLRKAGRSLCQMVLAGIFVAMLCLAGGCSRDDGSLRDASGNRASYAALRAENEALRRENQMLRRELVARKGGKAAASDGVPVKGGTVKCLCRKTPTPDIGCRPSRTSAITRNAGTTVR